MISVAEARAALLALVEPLGREDVPLRRAAGRVLARPLAATRDQPPFATSVMDGYAVRNAEVRDGATFRVIGEAAAGRRFEGALGEGEAVRIFTGAPLPQGADRVIIQEDVTREGEAITLLQGHDTAAYVRPAGADFRKGDRFEAPRRLSPSDVALLAAMNHATVPVHRRPEVAILSTGDELVQPGETPGPDQIIASNALGLAALVEQAGGVARLLPIARDTEASLALAFDLALGADLLVTIGGASEGDHDLVGKVAASQGLVRSFYKVAMRPGKPLMAGRIGAAAMVGLPGNPVSAMVCGRVFVKPMLDRLSGLPAEAEGPRIARLAGPLPANGPRAHYMRARLDGARVEVFDRQDSGLLTVLAAANALAIRPPHDPARAEGESIEVLPL